MGRQPYYIDDQKENVSLLLRLRLPWLFIGLILGAATPVITSAFAPVLEKNVSLAFFIPFIVYLAAAVGNQTQTIYVRNMSREKIKLGVYFAKELALGVIIGVLFGSIVGVSTYLWLKQPTVALSVGLAILASVSSATMIGLIIPTLLGKKHDPAASGGPFTTVVQDIVSLLIYFGISSAILLR